MDRLNTVRRTAAGLPRTDPDQAAPGAGGGKGKEGKGKGKEKENNAQGA